MIRSNHSVVTVRRAQSRDGGKKTGADGRSRRATPKTPSFAISPPPLISSKRLLPHFNLHPSPWSTGGFSSSLLCLIQLGRERERGREVEE